MEANPENFQNYKFSSYLAVISNMRTNIRRNELIELFGDRENLLNVTKENQTKTLSKIFNFDKVLKNKKWQY